MKSTAVDQGGIARPHIFVLPRIRLDCAIWPCWLDFRAGGGGTTTEANPDVIIV